jgi:hypothetical protein
MSDNDGDDDDDAQTSFEAERDGILNSLPPSVKDKFGTIGFFLIEDDGDDDDDDSDDADDKKVKNNASTPPQPKTYYQPALIVSPYDVPPKPVRDIYWHDAYMKAKRSKAKLAALDYLVYLYGSDDADDCYNFVAQDEFITLEEAQQQGLDKLPPELEERLLRQQKDGSSGKLKLLSDMETILVRGLEEMKADIDKEPKDRKPNRKFPFAERHETAAASSDGPPPKKQKT